MLPKTLKGRAFAASAAILLLLLGGVALFLDQRIRRFHDEEVLRRLRALATALQPAAGLLLDGAASTNGAPTAPRTAAAASRRALEGDRRHRVTVVAPAGQVLFDSAHELPLGDHSQRPEIVQARADGSGHAMRRSVTTGRDTVYVARRIDGPDGVVGFVRVADRLDLVASDAKAARKGLVAAGGVALVLGLAAAAWLARRLVRPLDELALSAESIARGGAAPPPPTSGPAEVTRLSRALHGLAGQLRAHIAGTTRGRSETDAILASLAEGVIAVDRAERLIHMNDAAARLLGLRHKPDAGTELWRVVRFPELEIALRDVLKGASGWQGDAPSPRIEGRVLRVVVGPVEPDVGAVAVLEDITELRRLEQMRIEFVANVSHELRTPLAALVGAIDTLSEPDTSEEVRKRFFDLGKRNADRLMAIVSDLLELSRIETEGTDIPVGPIDVAENVRQVARNLQGAADKNGIRLEVDAPPPGEATLTGNAHRLEQVFTNLVENAVKYTKPGGSVKVTVEAAPDAVVVAVKDTGIGIPREALPRVFERFYRVDRSRTRDMGGTGLGLAIVKHAVLAHGGRVSLDSEEGRGSTFTVTLPR